MTPSTTKCVTRLATNIVARVKVARSILKKQIERTMMTVLTIMLTLAILMEKCLLTILAIISEPPVEPSPLKIIPLPSPFKSPPRTITVRGLSVEIVIEGVTSSQKESMSMPKKLNMIKCFFRKNIAMMNKGILRTMTIRPTFQSKVRCKKVAMPLIPPLKR